MKRLLTCIECPMGCGIEVTLEEGRVTGVTGNSCPRGKLYAEAEVTCPMRVITTTVRTADGRMVPVKTSAPVKREDMFTILKKINALHPAGDIRMGDILVQDIGGAALVATDDCVRQTNC